MAKSSKQAQRQAWRFNTADAKLKSFQKWFQERVQARAFDVDVQGKPWTAKYVESGYKKGLSEAYRKSPQGRKDALRSVDFAKGTQQQFLRSSFFQAERVGKIQLLHTRTFEELKGITSAMSQKIARVLSEGLVRGENPRTLARKLAREVAGLTRTRALTLARTEIIHAAAEGQLDAFEDLGVEEVGVEAEWKTTGDDNVCELCEDLEGTVLPIDEARGLLPRHPNCRCSWIPALKDDKRDGQKRGRAADKALRASVKSEGRKSKSSWLGAEDMDD